MRKQSIFVIVALLTVALLGIVLNSVTVFYSPGIHKFRNKIRYEVFDSAFIVGSNGEKTNLTFCGTYDGKPYNGGCGSFRGVIDVAAYSVPYGAAIGLSANEDRGILFTEFDKYINANYCSIGIDSEGYAVPTGYQYTVILNPVIPDKIIVIVYDEDSRPVAAVVNGSTQEEADRIYRDYTDTLR